jgi:CheY-like chemotaxis protein
MARAAERRPDIALVDIRIKGKLDGIKTAQLLQESHGVPIVYMTAHADAATIERAARTRPYGYLHKPVRPAELRSVIEIALYNHSEQAQQARSGDGSSPDGAAPPRPAGASPPADREVRLQLEQILRSPDLDASRRSREFLGFIVEEALAGRAPDLTQGSIATRVFGRKDDFDALLDPIVRIQAGRLRRSLERYYLLGGKQDAIRIDLPRGASFRPPAWRCTAVASRPRRASSADPGDSAVGRGPAVRRRSSRQDSGRRAQPQDELTLEMGRYREAHVLLSGPPTAEHSRPLRFELRPATPRKRGLAVSARLVDRTTGEQVWGDEYHAT